MKMMMHMPLMLCNLWSLQHNLHYLHKSSHLLQQPSTSTVTWINLIWPEIFGLPHPQQSDVHSCSHFNGADVLLHPLQVSLKTLVWNLTSLNVLLAVVDLLGLVFVVVVADFAVGSLKGVRCRNTFFLICHFYFMLSLIYSYFLLSFYLCYDFIFFDFVLLDLLFIVYSSVALFLILSHTWYLILGISPV